MRPRGKARAPSFTRRSTGGVEVDWRRLLRARRRLEGDFGFGAVENLSADRARKGADQSIILPDCLVVIAAAYSNLVFGTFQLRLKCEEVLVGLEVRIGLDGHEQSSQ